MKNTTQANAINLVTLSALKFLVFSVFFLLFIPDSCLQSTLIGSIASSVVSGGLLVGGSLVDGGAVASRIALRRGNSGSSSVGVVGRGWGRSDGSGGNGWVSIYLRGNCRGHVSRG